MSEQMRQEIDKWNNLIMEVSKKKMNKSEIGDDDLFSAEYHGDKIEIERKFLKPGQEMKLLRKLKKFNLGSGHEEMELSKIDDDEYVFHAITYYGAPTQTIYFERIK